MCATSPGQQYIAGRVPVSLSQPTTMYAIKAIKGDVKIKRGAIEK